MNKKTLLNFWLLLLCMIVGGVSSAWGQVTIWSENFSAYSADAVPSGTISLPHTGTSLNASGTLTYACTNGTKTSGSTNGGTTAVKNENLADGSKPEIMVGKKGSGTGAVGGSFTATIPLDNIAGTITLKYKQNDKNLKVTITAGTASTNATNNTKEEQTVSLSGITADMTSVTIKFEATTTSNVRLDNIVLTGYKANVAITSIAFSEPKTATVGVGGTTTLSPTVLPANHTEVVDWESDATGVATVSNTGVVTGVAAGTAHITAKAHDNPSTIYDVCTVTVTAPVAVTGVSLKSSTTLLLGGTETLEAMVSPNDATNKNVTWSSADDTKVSVDENGVITGLALTGETPVNITVTTEDGSYEATCAVTVNPIPVSSVGLDKTSATLEVDQTLTLEATVSPDNATDKSVTWESDDEDVATVEDGVVTAVAAGTANITVTTVYGGKTATCEVTVVNKKGSIDAPYSVADVIDIAPTSKEVAAKSDVYVKGYIVGGFNTSSKFTTTSSEFQESNLALADDYNETTGSKTIPVEMKNGTTIRANYNPVDNTYKVGVAQVLIKADVIKYFGVPGLKSLDEMSTVAEAVTVTNVGFGTWASDNGLDFSGLGVKAYRATIDGTNISFTKVTEVPAGEGVLLQNEGTFVVPVKSVSAWDDDDNAFVRGTGAAVATGTGPYNYILNNVDDVVGFYKANGKKVAKNRAYLQSETYAARISLNLDDDQTTGIRNLTSTISEGDGAIYNLRGQRVENPSKGGLYIMNGKKVIFK